MADLVKGVRKANRSGERNVAYTDENENFIPATVLVDDKGNLVVRFDAKSNDKLELIYDELVKLNLQLTLLTGNDL